MSIVLAGIVVSEIARKVLPNDAQTPVSSLTISFPVSTGRDTTRNAEMQVQAYGLAADFDFVQGTAVIVEGTLLVDKISTSNGNRNIYSIDARRVHAGFEGLALNSVSLVGRVGGDPDVKYFESGTVKVDFSIASKRSTKQITDWYSIGLWGKAAEVAGNYVRKGGLVGIEGSLACEWWMDRNGGGERSKFVIKGERLTLLGGKRDEESNHAASDSRVPVGAGAGATDDIAF